MRYYSVVFLGLLLLPVSACSKTDHSLVGKWTARSVGGDELVLEFKDDETYSIINSRSGKEVYSSKYKRLSATWMEWDHYTPILNRVRGGPTGVYERRTVSVDVGEAELVIKPSANEPDWARWKRKGN